MYKIKKAFTLIEIILVIVIIAILFAAMMRFWSSRVGYLNNKYVKEQILDTYNDLYSDNLMSNYHIDSIYSQLMISFERWKWYFSYEYFLDGPNDQKNVQLEWWKYEIKEIFLSDVSVGKLDVILNPYNISCDLKWDNDNDWDFAKIKTVVNWNKEICFWLLSNNCRLDTIDCEEQY